MQVRIGVLYSPREIEVDLGDDDDGNAVVDDITKSLAEDSGMLWLTDRRGRRFGIPIDKLSYVEIGVTSTEHRVGFNAP
jgi:hypothetical protein